MFMIFRFLECDFDEVMKGMWQHISWTTDILTKTYDCGDLFTLLCSILTGRKQTVSIKNVHDIFCILLLDVSK